MIPNAYIVTCGHDVLRDDGLLYVRRLRASKGGARVPPPLPARAAPVRTDGHRRARPRRLPRHSSRSSVNSSGQCSWYIWIQCSHNHYPYFGSCDLWGVLFMFSYLLYISTRTAFLSKGILSELWHSYTKIDQLSYIDSFHWPIAFIYKF